MRSYFRDLWYAVRVLLKNPGFTLIVVSSKSERRT
jgi:hypothetical protein